MRPCAIVVVDGAGPLSVRAKENVMKLPTIGVVLLLMLGVAAPALAQGGGASSTGTPRPSFAIVPAAAATR